MKKRLSLQDKAELALKNAIRKLVAEHRKNGLPLYVWENGKVVNGMAKKKKRK